jgi:sugar lactone lactonase YvrE
MNAALLRATLSAAGIALLAVAAQAAEAPKFRHVASAFQDKDGKALKGPEGVACNDDFAVIVADTGNGRLLRYAFDGEQFRGGEEIPLPERAYPARVQMSSKGEIYCLDSRKRQILRVGAGGTAAYVEFTGIPDPAAVMAWSFKLGSDDNLYVLDPTAGRVLILDPGGRFLRKIQVPADVGSLDDLAVDPRGNVFLLDGARGTLYQAAKDAQSFSPLVDNLKTFLNFSTDLTVGPRGAIYLTDQNGGGIVVLGPDGSFLARHSSYGWKEGLLRHPAQICANGKDAVVVADRDNNRIQLFLTR